MDPYSGNMRVPSAAAAATSARSPGVSVLSARNRRFCATLSRFATLVHCTANAGRSRSSARL